MILGLSGKALAGKDTTADYLLNKYNFDIKLSFAANLKEMCKSIFNLSDGDVNNQHLKGLKFINPVVVSDDHIFKIISWMRKTHTNIYSGPLNVSFLSGKILSSPREVLQYVGTDVVRSVCDTYHVDVISDKLSLYKNVVISDVRFLNEVNVIKNKGGFVVRLSRDLSISGDKKKHPSEVALDDFNGWDFVLNNHSSIDYLYNLIDEMIFFLRKVK